MTLSKTLSTLSLAGALVAAAVALSPSEAAAGFGSQTRVSSKVGSKKTSHKINVNRQGHGGGQGNQVIIGGRPIPR